MKNKVHNFSGTEFDYVLKIQENANTVKPHNTRSQGTNNFFLVIGGNLLLPIYENSFVGQGDCFHYRRNYGTSGSGIAGCNCF